MGNDIRQEAIPRQGGSFRNIPGIVRLLDNRSNDGTRALNDPLSRAIIRRLLHQPLDHNSFPEVTPTSKNETLSTIERLRTVRRNQFSKKPIPDEDFEAVLQACVRAANASNRQSYSLIIADEAVRQKLNWPGDRAVVFCVDFARLARLADAVHVPYDFDRFQPFLTGVIDTALALQTAVITARSLGIDYLITNDACLKDREAIYRELRLPERYCFPLAAVFFGYPREEPTVKKGRLREGRDPSRLLRAAD